MIESGLNEISCYSAGNYQGYVQAFLLIVYPYYIFLVVLYDFWQLIHHKYKTIHIVFHLKQIL